MNNLSPELQRLVDRMAIHDVLVRYFDGADRGDRAIVASCFTQDVRAHYDGRPPVTGLAAFMDQIPLFARLASGETTICTHFMGNLNVRSLDDASAQTEVYAFACLVNPEGGGQVVHMRKLRYLDRWRKVSGEWKISAREKTLDWSFQAPASFALEFRQRLQGIPESLGR